MGSSMLMKRAEKKGVEERDLMPKKTRFKKPPEEETDDKVAKYSNTDRGFEKAIEAFRTRGNGPKMARTSRTSGAIKKKEEGQGNN